MPCPARSQLTGGGNLSGQKTESYHAPAQLQQSRSCWDSVKGTGHAPLKEEIARRAVSYGCHITPETLLITNGCIEALSLALRATLSQGMRWQWNPLLLCTAADAA